MKRILFFTFLIVATNAANDELWVKFKRDYGKVYQNEEEEQRRHSIFQSNLKVIEEHNTEYFNRKISYLLQINQFADLTDEEFLNNHLEHTGTGFENNMIDSVDLPEPHYFEESTLPPVPDAIDWRINGTVIEIRDQGSCGGGGWAYSLVGALEAQNIIHHNISLPLSAQQFIDCTYINKGCSGGDVVSAMSWFLDDTIYTEESYTHNGTNGSCGIGKDSGLLITDAFMVIPQEENLKNVVGTRGPVIVGINAAEFRFYGAGIYNNPNCSQKLNHKALAVGYGTRDDLDYWILLNSWGTGWGDNGYIYMARNRGQQCGIGTRNNIPIIH